MLNKRQDRTMSFNVLFRTLALLLVCLTTDANNQASSSDCQSYDMSPFDDLPRGFFTTRIPRSRSRTLITASKKSA